MVKDMGLGPLLYYSVCEVAPGCTGGAGGLAHRGIGWVPLLWLAGTPLSRTVEEVNPCVPE